MKFFAFVLLICGSASCCLEAAHFRGLGDLPGGPFFSAALGVSADGKVVVGTSRSSNGYEAFRWTAEAGMQGLGDLPGGTFASQASGVSVDGSVIAGYGTRASGNEAFRWTPTNGMVGIGDLPGGIFYSSAWAISGDGNVIVGESSSTVSPTYYEAFRWTAATGMVGLGELPGGRTNSQAFAVSADGSVIVGASGSAAGTTWEAFRWSTTNGMRALGDFTGGPFNSVAYGISPDGSVIVGRGHTGVEASSRWTADAGWVHLGFLPCDTWSTAFGASAGGTIIVGSPNQGRGDCAFIWDADHGIRHLRTVLSNDFGLNVAGWQLTHARAITPDGKIIIGYGTNASGQAEAWIANLNPPSLHVTRAGDDVVLSWNTNGPPFILEHSLSLTASSWNSNSLPVFRVGDTFSVTNPASAQQQFFRLRRP